jgi:predicted nucleic acid-binding protein
MPRTRYTLDTSVAVKWFLEEEDSDKAKDILNYYEAKEIELFAPDLLLVELANVLHYNRCYNSNEIANIVTNVRQNLSFILLNDHIIAKALQLSAKFEVPVYDTVFLAIAVQSNQPLITADSRMYRKLDEETSANVIF